MFTVLEVVVLALATQHATSFLLRPPTPLHTRSRVLKAYDNDDDKPAFSLGSLLVLTIGVVGVFGTYFQPMFNL